MRRGVPATHAEDSPPTPVARSRRTPARGPRSARRRILDRAGVPLLLAGPVLGVLLIGLSYRSALHDSGTAPFTLFWLGMAVGAAPPAAYAVGRSASARQRQLAVTVLALFSFVPKYLRTAAGPLYFDERAHWLQVRTVVAEHHLFVPNNSVPIIQFYPGLHALTAAVTEMTGLGVWTVCEIIIAVVHVLGALAVFLLAGTVLSPRGAGLAAVVYMTNSEWVYFDTQFAYESLGVVLVLWAVYFAARLYRARAGAERACWAALVVVTGWACVLTHHLSSLALSLVLVLCVVVSAVSAGRSRRGWIRTAWLCGPTVVVAASLVAYILRVAPSTTTYLGSSAGNAAGQFVALLTSLTEKTSGQDGSRTPFAGSQVPSYELLCAYGAPLVVAAVVAAHFLSSRGFTRDVRRGLALAGSILATGYVLSVPLVLTSAGSELARRSWAFTYLGVALVGGRTGARLLRRAAARRAVRLVGVLGIAGACAVLSVGNLAAGENVAYRFPGPYIYGSDTRSVTTDMVAAERWWASIRPAGSGVLADRYNGVLYVDAPGAKVATPQMGAMDYYLHGDPIPPAVASALAAGGYDYLIIDKNITKYVPLLGGYFNPDEPADGPPKPVDAAFIDRWATSPYTTRVYDSDQIAIYRLDPRYVSVTAP